MDCESAAREAALSGLLERRVSLRTALLAPAALSGAFLLAVLAWVAVPMSRSALFFVGYFNLAFYLNSMLVSSLYFHLQLRSLRLPGTTAREALATWLAFWTLYFSVLTPASLAIGQQPGMLVRVFLSLLMPAVQCSAFALQMRARRAPCGGEREQAALDAAPWRAVQFYGVCIASYMAMFVIVGLFERSSSAATRMLAVSLFHSARVGATRVAALVSARMPSALLDWENYAVFFVSGMFQLQLRWLTLESVGWRLVPIIVVGYTLELLQYPLQVTAYAREKRWRRWCACRRAPGRRDLEAESLAVDVPNPLAVTPASPAGPPSTPEPTPAAPSHHRSIAIWRSYHSYELVKVLSLVSFTAMFVLLSISPNIDYFPLAKAVAANTPALTWCALAAGLLALEALMRWAVERLIFARVASLSPGEQHHLLFGNPGSILLYTIAMWHLLSVSMNNQFVAPP